MKYEITPEGIYFSRPNGTRNFIGRTHRSYDRWVALVEFFYGGGS